MTFSLNKIVRPSILALQPYSSARDEFSGTEGIFIDANENPFGELNRYPDPYQKELKAKIGEVKNVAKEHVFVGNGSDEIIDLLFRIFCEPGRDKVAALNPSYGMYEVSAALNNVGLVHIPLNDDFQIDISTAVELLKDASIKLLFLCSPNNPTGNTVGGLETLLQNFSGLVVVDEAYIDFSTRPSFIHKLAQYPNLVVLQTLSKAWGLAAARIGMAFADRGLIGLLNKVKPPYNVSLLNQQAALNALNHLDLFEGNKKIILEQRNYLSSELSLIPQVVHVYPSDANFLLVKTTDADGIYQFLTAQKIIVRNRNKVAPGCLRITVGTENENKKLIAALQNYQA
ncbi:MAG: histidinol-phosphate transaminase [Edaphocola sp.]